jgi:predicted Zn-dependent protease
MKNRIYEFENELKGLRNFLPELVSVLENGIQEKIYAFVCIEDLSEKSANISLTENIREVRDRGIILRIFAGDKNFEYAANNFDRDFLLKKAALLREKALKYLPERNRKFDFIPNKWEDEKIEDLHPFIKDQISRRPQTTDQVHFGTRFDEEYPLNFNLKNMADYARNTRKEILDKANGYLSQAGTSLRQKVRTKIFADRYRNMSQSLLTSYYYLYAISPKGMTSDFSKGGMCGFEHGKDIDDMTIEHVVEMAKKFDNAEHLSPGRYRIITGPDVTGVIAHEAFGHTQEGDTCRLKRSCAPGLKKSGTKVGNDMATIINNAALFDMANLDFGPNGTHFFDDEGQIARPQVILDKGYLGTPMNDLLNSLLGDINGPAPRQSNGKRESWRRPLIPRQTNTYFTPGDRTKDELIRMIDYGFIAEYAYGGMEDPKGMGLTAGTKYLEEIKDGKLTGRIFLGPKGGHIELSDPVPLLLNGIIAKSKVLDEYEGDLDKQPEPVNKCGGCGKYHKESVEAGCGGPWILWDGINCG